jgi:hypothetical protein
MTRRPLPSPGDPDAPKYWLYETGGQLRAAVENYLHGRDMSVRDVSLMRAYLSQWVQSPVWANPFDDSGVNGELAKLRAAVGAIANAADISAWLHAALAWGIDPL